MRQRARVYGPYRHGERWRVHFVTTGPGGDRTTTYETFDSRAAAQRCFDGAHDEAQGVTVTDAIEQFLECKRAEGKAELTIEAYEQRLTALLGDYLHRPVRSIARRGGELYAAALSGRKPDSHQNLLVAGRIWARWCMRQRLLRVDPFADVDPIGKRTHGADKERLTVDESRQLEQWCLAHSGDIGAVLTLGYLYLGARAAELCRRNVRDLDDDGRLLWIGKTKTRAGQRSLRIPDGLAGMLIALTAGRNGDEPIFRDNNGNRMSRHVARLRVRRTCAAAGVTELSPQALRRTQATIATEASETALAVARHLGHARPNVAAQSYIDRDAVTAARGAAALRVIRGGRP
jgi:integrase